MVCKGLGCSGRPKLTNHLKYYKFSLRSPNQQEDDMAKVMLFGEAICEPTGTPAVRLGQTEIGWHRIVQQFARLLVIQIKRSKDVQQTLRQMAFDIQTGNHDLGNACMLSDEEQLKILSHLLTISNGELAEEAVDEAKKSHR